MTELPILVKLDLHPGDWVVHLAVSGLSCIERVLPNPLPPRGSSREQLVEDLLRRRSLTSNFASLAPLSEPAEPLKESRCFVDLCRERSHRDERVRCSEEVV